MASSGSTNLVAIPVILISGGVAVGALIAIAEAGFGLAGSLFTGSAPIAAGLASVVAPAAAAGVGLGGVALFANVTINVVKQVQKEPYPWLLMSITAVASVLCAFVSEFLGAGATGKVLTAVMGAATTLVGGALFHQGHAAARVVGVGMFLVPPGTLSLLILRQIPPSRVAEALARQGAGVWVALFMLLLVSAACVFISTLPDKAKPKI